MTTMLDELVGEIVDAVLDGTRREDETVCAASRVADLMTDPKTTRQAITRAVADLIIAIDRDLAERDVSVLQAAYRLVTPKQPIEVRNFCCKPVVRPRRWRVARFVPAGPVDVDVTAALLGDPAPGRSAWDRKQGAENG